jgi:hypothetical protein
VREKSRSAAEQDRIPSTFPSKLEAAAGFEPAIGALQARALPLGYAAIRLLAAGTSGSTWGRSGEAGNRITGS